MGALYKVNSRQWELLQIELNLRALIGLCTSQHKETPYQSSFEWKQWTKLKVQYWEGWQYQYNTGRVKFNFKVFGRRFCPVRKRLWVPRKALYKWKVLLLLLLLLWLLLLRYISAQTCSPTLIFLVSAPSGKEAWTRGTVLLARWPPSGPIWLLSCLMRDTTAKYCGKSLVMMRQIRFLSSSSELSSSAGGGISVSD